MIRRYPVAFAAVLAVGLSAAFAPRKFERTVYGTVFLHDGSPATGYRVRAYDDDLPGDDNDELMQETRVDAAGNYSMQYRRGSWDGPHSNRHTQWRPDIYVVVAKPKPGGGWKRVYQSDVEKNWPVAKDVRWDVRLPDDGECPATAKFQTTGVWRGCNCPDGTYKRFLDVAHYEARCAEGPSPRIACERTGGQWVGWDNRYGRCVREEPDVPSAHRSLRREAYYAYMRRVSSGVTMESLPAWAVSRYQSYYPNVKLSEITIGESKNTPTAGTAITDCRKIYYPVASGQLASIRADTGVKYHWLLHEIAHSEQCMALEPGALSFSTKRDKYADMWFANLPVPVLLSILEDGIPADNSVHDKMPMEEDADRQAARILRATGGTVPPPPTCPAGTFSTRDHRGCRCQAGTTKAYIGFFDESARCR